MIFSQEKDSVAVKPKWKYQPNFMVGADVLNAGLSAFSNRKLFQGFVSTRFNKKLHLVGDIGFEKNVYQKNAYDASANGFFGKLGAYYMLVMDSENELNGFYGGGKLAASVYKQEYAKIPIKGFSGSNSSTSYPASSQSSYWIEANIGGRIKLFQTRFYIDAQVQPRYLLYSTKQDGITPMIVPGFGKSSGKFNMGFSWYIAYQF